MSGYPSWVPTLSSFSGWTCPIRLTEADNRGQTVPGNCLCWPYGNSAGSSHGVHTLPMKEPANSLHARQAPLVGIVLQLNRREASPYLWGHHVAYFAALEQVGLLPIGIPPFRPELLHSVYLNLGGVLLAGGPDVAPQRYGEKALFPLEGPDEMLDEAELQLAAWCLQDGKPLLGICRGLQLLNVVTGGTLYQDLSEQTGTAIDHRLTQPVSRRAQPAHRLELDPECWLSREMAQTAVDVNSMHHQGIKRLGDGMEAFGWAPDGLIEAAQLPDHPFAVAFQGHLEEIIGVQSWARLVFEQFAAAVFDWATHADYYANQGHRQRRYNVIGGACRS